MKTTPDIFEQLKDHSTLPPPHLFDMVVKKIQSDKLNGANDPVIPTLPARNKNVFSINRHYWAAAACVLVILSGWLVYSTIAKTPQRKDNNNFAVQQPGETNTTVTNGIAANDKKKNVVVRNVAITTKKQAQSNMVWMVINDEKIPVTDNDLLFTFASYLPGKAPAFLLDESKENIYIRVDSYSAIALTPEIRAMMKRMYEVRRNHKPTARARRERRKLERWKKEDQSHFDKKIDNNPVDPFDLGDFILDK